MEIIVRTHHVDVTPALKDYVQEKLQKLEHFFDNIQEIVVELDISENSAEEDRQMAKGLIKASGTIIRASESTKNMYASIDLLVDKLEVQVKKHKERVKDHKPHRDFRSIDGGRPPKPKRKVAGNNHEPRYIPKPMMPEDAAILLETNGFDFLVFRNATSESINVIYPGKNGEFGLIET